MKTIKKGYPSALFNDHHNQMPHMRNKVGHDVEKLAMLLPLCAQRERELPD
jgi:hypothetical protein